MTSTSYIIRTHARSYDQLQVGTIMRWLGPKGEVPGGWETCRGQYLKIADYPELYEVIGDTECPPTLPRNLWRRLLRLPERPNPDYRPGYFRLPDLEGA